MSNTQSFDVCDAEQAANASWEESPASAPMRPASDIRHDSDRGRAWLIVLAGVINESVSWGAFDCKDLGEMDC